LPRRGLLLAGAGFMSTAGLGAVAWTASRWPGVRPQRVAGREAPARRAAIWQARVAVPRPRVMAAAGGMVCVAGDMGARAPLRRWRDVVQALNAHDGSHRWTFAVRVGLRGTSAVDPVGVAAAGSRVYVAVNRLACLRASDGAGLWSAPSPLASNALVAGHDAVYSAPTSLFALRDRDGARLWSFPTDANSAPLLVNGVIYLLGVGPQGGPVLLAIRASDGIGLWDSPGPRMGWLACDGQIVCAVSGSDMEPPPGDEAPPSQMWTWRASDGRPLWRSAANAGFSSPPAMTAGIACALTNRALLAVDPRDGRALWSYPATAPAPPVAAHGRIYTRTPAHELVALNARDGTPAWHCPTRYTFGPHVAGNTVYVCDHTTVYAIPA
jgi:outer membrane protein assembly factor BamB